MARCPSDFRGILAPVYANDVDKEQRKGAGIRSKIRLYNKLTFMRYVTYISPQNTGLF